MNFESVCSEMPSIFIPSFDTKRANFFSCLAGHSALVQCSVFVPLASLTRISVAAWQTGHSWGISKAPSVRMTLMTFGMILFALMTLISVPAQPIPNRSHSLILQSEARLTVVPSNSTGRKTATGEMVEAAHDHSICCNTVSAASSCHLKASPALVA